MDAKKYTIYWYGDWERRVLRAMAEGTRDAGEIAIKSNVPVFRLDKVFCNIIDDINKLRKILQITIMLSLYSYTNRKV